MAILILYVYANHIDESERVIIDYFAIALSVQNADIDPSVLMSDIQMFLEQSWQVRFQNISITGNQSLMSYTPEGLISLQKLDAYSDLEFLGRLYKLVMIKTTRKHMTSISGNLLFICKICVCPLIEIAVENVHLLYENKMLYTTEKKTYFGDMEFVISVNDIGKTTVKMCWDGKNISTSANINHGVQCNRNCVLCYYFFSVLVIYYLTNGCL